MRDRLNGLWRDDRGVTSIEYAVIAGLLSIAISAVVSELGTEVANLFISVKSSF